MVELNQNSIEDYLKDIQLGSTFVGVSQPQDAKNGDIWIDVSKSELCINTIIGGVPHTIHVDPYKYSTTASCDYQVPRKRVPSVRTCPSCCAPVNLQNEACPYCGVPYPMEHV